MSLIETLQQSTWCHLLTPAEFDRVASDAFERHVPAGAYVAHMGDPVEHWTGVIDGLLKMSVTSAQGKVSTLTGACAGAWYGEGSLIKREPRRYDVVALRASCVAQIPISTFEWLRGRSLPFNHHLQHLLNARLSVFIGMLEYDRLLTTDARVARCLASLFNTDLYPEQKSFVDLHQQEIALLCGMSRQRVNVALGALQRANLLRVEARGVTVLDLDGLRQFAGTD
jgi:CRP-like cAMP-binding protein